MTQDQYNELREKAREKLGEQPADVLEEFETVDALMEAIEQNGARAAL